MKTLSQDNPQTLREAVETLRRGGVIALPTETVYGLVCRWDDAAARERIYALKRRPSNKLLQMLAADLTQAATFGVTVTLYDESGSAETALTLPLTVSLGVNGISIR